MFYLRVRIYYLIVVVISICIIIIIIFFYTDYRVHCKYNSKKRISMLSLGFNKFYFN